MLRKLHGLMTNRGRHFFLNLVFKEQCNYKNLEACITQKDICFEVFVVNFSKNIWLVTIRTVRFYHREDKLLCRCQHRCSTNLTENILLSGKLSFN